MLIGAVSFELGQMQNSCHLSTSGKLITLFMYISRVPDQNSVSQA